MTITFSPAQPLIAAVRGPDMRAAAPDAPGAAAAPRGLHMVGALQPGIDEEESSQPESLAMSTLKTVIKDLEKQIAARREALAQIMADDSLPADVKRDRARMIQMEIAALQMGISRAFQQMSKLLNEEKGSAVGTQVDTQA